MKILIVYKMSGLSDNPFVRLLAEGIRACGCEVTCSVDEFWDHTADYDIVHFQWPEEVFGWSYPDSNQLAALADRLTKLSSRGIPIVYTRHNTRPHVGNREIMEAYRLLETAATAVVHLGNYSREEFLATYPDSTQLHPVIPHHLYEKQYDLSITREQARATLHIPTDHIVLLSFGAFRHTEERRLVWGAFRRLRCPKKYLLAPRLYPFTLRGSYYTGVKRLLEIVLYGLVRLVEQLFSCRISSPDKLIPDEMLPYFFMAADVVFIQRSDILNSGNVPLGFTFGRVVVGPRCGNITELLTDCGNPVFDPNDPRSVDQAVHRAVDLAKQGQGERNREAAFAHFRLAYIAECYTRLYKEIHVRKHK